MIDLKDHVDWVVDSELENKVMGDDHASLSLEKVVAPEPAKNEDTAGLQFKEILCPHNNLAATAMLGGLFEGETIEQNTASNESGKVEEKE